MISDAFEHRRHFCDRDNETQIARGGLSQRDDVDALAIDFDFEMIDLIVVLENLLGDFGITFAERIHCTFECLFRFAPEQENAIAQELSSSSR